MKHFLVWDTISMAWTEIGLGPEDYPKIAEKLRSDYSNWSDIDNIIKGDVLGSFAIDSLLLPLAFIPIIGIFLIAPFPDWGYEETYLKARIAKWGRIPRWQHYLNLLRLAGYPIAWLISFSVRYRLKIAFHRLQT
jgi:hypothetical protein